jgi:hypothetical protein
MKATQWAISILAMSIFATTAALAGESTHERKEVFKLKTADAEMIEADVTDLAIGESETFVTESGRTVDLLRTEDGMEIYLDGELLEMDSNDEVVHGKHVMIHSDVEVECSTDTGDECEHEMVFINASDDVEVLDGDQVKVISKHVEVICDEDEECEEMVWISDGGDLHTDDLHEAGEGHKVIKIKTHKDE